MPALYQVLSWVLYLSDYIPEDTFEMYFGILFLIFTGLYILYKNIILTQPSVRKRSVTLRSIVFISSFLLRRYIEPFGVGGGIIFVPSMVLVLGLTMHRAAATSQLTLLMTSLSGVFTHSFLGHPQYVSGTCFVCRCLYRCPARRKNI